MTTITIAYEVPQAAFDRVVALAANVPTSDVNYNGADIKVTRDDFTAVDDSDGIRGATLMARVYRAIDGE